MMCDRHKCRRKENMDFMLYKAAKTGHHTCADALIKAGADVNSSWVPLKAAAENGYDECVDVVVKAGADVNAWHEEEGGVILLAAKYGFAKCLESLIKGGADVNDQNMYGESPVQLAADSNREDCVKYLLTSGADVNIQTNEGLTAAMSAASRGYHECLEMLIKGGADLNLLDENKETALCWAAKHKKHKFREAKENFPNRCVELLLKAGAAVNTKETSLHKALRQNLNYVTLLLERGAEVNGINDFGETALMMAAYGGYQSSIKQLLEAGADVNKADSSGQTALLIVLDEEHYECIEQLCAAGADVNLADNLGFTALHALMTNFSTSDASDPNLLNPIKCLLASGAYVNKLSKFGESVTSLYMEEPHSEKQIRKRVLKLLFAAGEKEAKFREHRNRLSLSGLCRKVIRKHLLKLDPHENLFCRVPRLEISSELHDYLLYDQTLNPPKQ